MSHECVQSSASWPAMKQQLTAREPTEHACRRRRLGQALLLVGPDDNKLPLKHQEYSTHVLHYVFCPTCLLAYDT